MPKIVMEIDNCWDCPFLGTEASMLDPNVDRFYCKKMKGKMIAGYIEQVEFKDDMPPIPDWCPCLLKNMNLVRRSDVYQLAGKNGIIRAHVADVDLMEIAE